MLAGPVTKASTAYGPFANSTTPDDPSTSLARSPIPPGTFNGENDTGVGPVFCARTAARQCMTYELAPAGVANWYRKRKFCEEVTMAPAPPSVAHCRW